MSNDPYQVIIPLKSFRRAKSRLRDSLGEDGAADLARSLAHQVLEASRPRTALVVSEDPDVLDFASGLGAQTLLVSEQSLNAAVSAAYRRLDSVADYAIVAHGDLAQPEGLGTTLFSPGVSVYLDQWERGTNVLVLPTGLDFTFCYGPDSAHSHVDEARRLGLEVHIVRDSPWRYDVDEPPDARDLELR